MKKSILLTIVTVILLPVFNVGAIEMRFDIGHIFYTNKSPFLLEGMVEPGSTVTVSSVNKAIVVDKDGKFSVDLPLKEGVNLFSMVIENKGNETIKCIMVEMDSTPPEVALLVKDKPTQDKDIIIDIFDALEFSVTGFTEPDCKIMADDVDYSSGKVKFEAKFKVDTAPSKSNHKIEIIDKFGNKTVFEVKAVNAHIRTLVLQIGNPVATIDGKEIRLPKPPENIGGTTMIPVRFIVVDVLGGTVSFDNKTRTLNAKADNTTLVIQAGNNEAYINNKKMTITQRAPTIWGNVMIASYRFLGEIFGFNINYDAETKTITMTKAIYE